MRELLTVPDPRLRQESKPVDEINSQVVDIAAFLLSQLQPLEAVGLAAPQFGEMIRIIVFRRDYLTKVVLINPEIIKEKGSQLSEEGCKSIPGKVYLVIRPSVIKIRGLNLSGERITIRAHDLLARVLKHEMDHLDGVLIDSIGEPI